MNAGFRFPMPDLRSKVRFDWNDERVAALRKFAAQKMSATEIKNAFGGGVTRSAVLGKAMRIGVKIDSGARGLARPKGRGGEPKPISELRRHPRLPPFPGARVNGSGKHASDCRAGEGGASRHTTRRSGDVGTAAAVERSAAALNAPAPDIFTPMPARLLTIHELTADSCRWPLGDPGCLDTFRYCGAHIDRIGVVSYCPAHIRMAYQPRGGA